MADQESNQLSKIINPEVGGIMRDKTSYSSNMCIDGLNVRFVGGLPQKYAGYVKVSNGASEVVTNMQGIAPNSTSVLSYLGRPSTFKFATFYSDAHITPEFDITPPQTPPYPFIPSDLNTWSIASFTQLEENACASPVTPFPQKDQTYIITAAVQNLQNINQTGLYQVFFAKINSFDILQPLAETDPMSCDQSPIMTNSFVCRVGQYLFINGLDGLIQNCAAGDLTSWPIDNVNYLDSPNLVQALPNTAGSTPSILVWGSDALWLGTLSPIEHVPDNFNFVKRGECTIISPYSVVNVNSIYYWVGNRALYGYNGAVYEIENIINKDYFFNNLNWDYCGRIWSIYLPLYNELAIFYPRGSSTVANAVIFYNPTRNEFWDNQLGRSAGIYMNGFPYPIMADSLPTTISTTEGPISRYFIWMHEYGVDKVVDGISYAIESYYIPPYFSLHKLANNIDKQVDLERFEPDYQTQNTSGVTAQMTIQPITKGYPNSAPNYGNIYSFDNTTPFISMSEQGRLVTFKIGTNVVGGDYYAGLPTIIYDPSDILPSS